MIFNRKIKSIEEARTDFFSQFELPSDTYKYKDVSGKSGFYRHFSHATEGAHLINVQLSLPRDKYLLSFDICKKSRVIKELKEYDTDSIRIQSKAFRYFTKRMVTYEEEVQTIYFNMIEDVKESILTLQNVSSKISIEETVKDDNVLLKLFIGKVLIGRFDITSVKVTDELFHLVINYTVVEKQAEVKQQQTIDVITDNESHFETKMKSILDQFKIADFINELSDAVKHFDLFFNSNESGLQNLKVALAWTGKPDNDLERKFTMTTADQQIEGKINFIINANDVNSFGYYTIAFDNGLTKEHKFNRMKVSEFYAFLKSLSLPELFESLYEKIRKIYQSTLKDNYEQKLIQYSEKVKNPTIVSNKKTTTYQSSTDGSPLMDLIFEEISEKNVNLFLTSTSPSLESLQLSFQRKSASLDIITEFIQTSVKMIKFSKENRAAFGTKNISSPFKSSGSKQQRVAL